MKTLFITASGTGTGKTYIAAALAAALSAKGRRVAALKPVITGFSWDEVEETDTAILIRALGGEPSPEAVEACSPWRFEAPLSPDMAARREGRTLDFEALVGFCRNARNEEGDVLLIEGIGGVMVPLDGALTVLDWIAAVEAPALVVTGSYLGTLSHTLTAVDALRHRDLPVAGVVVDESEESPVPPAETVETLARLLEGEPVAPVGRGAGPAEVYGALARMIGA